VSGNDLLSSLEFKEYGSVHNQVGSEIANVMAAKKYGNSNFLLNGQTFFHQCQAQRITVNGFEKTEPQLVIDLVEDPNDCIGQFRMFVIRVNCHFSISVISVNQW